MQYSVWKWLHCLQRLRRHLLVECGRFYGRLVNVTLQCEFIEFLFVRFLIYNCMIEATDVLKYA